MLFRSLSHSFKILFYLTFCFETNNMFLQLNRCKWSEEHTQFDHKINPEWLIFTFISGLALCIICMCFCKCSFKKKLKSKALKNLEIMKKSIEHSQKGDLESQVAQLSTITEAYKQLDWV